MREARWFQAAASLLLFCFVPAAAQIQIENVLGSDAVASEALLKLRPGYTATQLAQGLTFVDITPLGTSGVLRLRAQSMTASALLALLSSNPMVAWVEPNYVISTSDTLPNDPFLPNQWGLRNTGQTVANQVGTPQADISAAKAWDITAGSPDIMVAVVDTGTDYRHVDLSANVWTAPRPYTITIGATTYNCPAGSHGFNAVALNCDPLDDNTHGSHVSGIIGARGDNQTGVTGVNWKTSIVALKALNLYGSGSAADAVNAIEAAIQLKAQGFNIRVMNASWGSTTSSIALLQAILDANAADILFVAAAGNAGTDNGISPHYPASYTAPNIISVAATDNRDALAGFSSFGQTTVHLGAPGVYVYSTLLSDNYGYLSGTSMATPHVTGAAALVLSRCALNTADLKKTLLASVDPTPALANTTITGGRLNVFRALTQCGATPVPDFLLSAAPQSLTLMAGNTGVSQITVLPLFGFSSNVSFSVSGLPAGVTAALLPVSSPSGTSLSLTVGPGTQPGLYPITVQGISGGLNNALTVNLTVAGPDFTISAPASVSLSASSPSVSQITITPVSGFNGTVQLSAVGLPTGLSASFSPGVISVSGTSTLTLTATPTAAWGNFTIGLLATTGPLAHQTSMGVTVVAPADFSLSASPTAVTVAPGASGASTITVGSQFGFSGPVNLSLSGLPSGITAVFGPAVVNGAGTSTLTFNAGSGAAIGSYPVTITGVSGSLSHTTSVTLVIASLPALQVNAQQSLNPGDIIPLTITLPSPAPAGGLDVAVASSAPGIASVSLSSTYIPAGQTGSSRPRITGVANGPAVITVSANGFSPGSISLQVGTQSGSLSFNPTGLNLTAPSNASSNLILSVPAPSTGLTVNLSSSNTAAATVPPFVNLPGGATSVHVPVTAVLGGTAIITASAPPNYSAAVLNVTVSSPLTITTTYLPNGQVGTFYSQALNAVGGTTPFKWSLIAGTLPGTLSLNPATGLVSGTPGAPVTATPLRFQVTDSSSPMQSATVDLTLTISAAPTAGSIAPASGTPQGTLVNTAFSTPLGALVRDTGANPMAGVSVLFACPATGAGCTFSGGGTTATVVTNGSGIATSPAVSANATPGGYLVTASVAGLSSGAAFSLTNLSGPSIGLPAALSVQPGSDVGLPITLPQSAPAGGLSITLTSSNPAIASVNLSNVFVPQGQNGTTRPRVNGLAAGIATITATAAGYAPSSTIVTVGSPGNTISFSPPSITIAGSSNGSLNLLLSQPAPLSGLTIPLASDNTAVASVPSQVVVLPGASNAAVPVTGGSPGTATVTAGPAPNYSAATATVTVIGPLAITTTSLPSGNVGTPYLAALTATGGNPGYSWSLTGALPSGLNFNPATGILNGTPQATANALPLSFRVTDSSTPAQSATVNLTLTIGAQTGPAILAPPLLSAAVNGDVAMTATLSTPAPAGGLDLTITSSNPSIAAPNLTLAFIPQGQTATSRPRVKGISPGVAIITISGAGYAPASVTVQVQ